MDEQEREEFVNRLWKELQDYAYRNQNDRGEHRCAGAQSSRSSVENHAAGARANGKAGAGEGADKGAGEGTRLTFGITDRELEICRVLGIEVPEYVRWRLPDPPPVAKNLPDGGIRVGEVIAHRWWRVLKDASGKPYLRSCLTKWVWPHGQALEADRDPVTERHGIYCFKTPESAAEEPMGVVMGRVAIWGRIVEHANGYRAQYALPVAFDHVLTHALAPTHIKHLRRAYGLPEDGSCAW